MRSEVDVTKAVALGTIRIVWVASRRAAGPSTFSPVLSCNHEEVLSVESDTEESSRRLKGTHIFKSEDRDIDSARCWKVDRCDRFACG